MFMLLCLCVMMCVMLVLVFLLCDSGFFLFCEWCMLMILIIVCVCARGVYGVVLCVFWLWVSDDVCCVILAFFLIL